MHLRLRLNILLVVCLAVLLGYWVIACAVIATDPYDLYPWGTAARYDRNDVTDNNKLLVRAVAKDPQAKVVIIGSSTAKFYSLAQWQAVYKTPNVGTLIYRGVRPGDRDIVLNNFIRYSSARHFVIWFDHSYAFSGNQLAGDFPDYSYDEELFNDLRLINGRAMSATLRIWRGKDLYPQWRKRFAEELAGDVKRYRTFQSAESRVEIADRVARTPPFRKTPRANLCAPESALVRGLINPIAILDRMGRSVDIIIPAYSPLFYYFKGDGSPGLDLSDQLELRRCLVENTSRLRNVRVVALDADPVLTEQFENFADPGHIMTKSALQRSLENIAGNRFNIGKKNLDEYQKHLKSRVNAVPLSWHKAVAR
jgi:hypothetical protein